MQAFVFEKDLPIPARRRTPGESKYPFGLMEIGDSVRVNGGKFKSAIAAAYKHGRENGKSFTDRKIEPKAVRIWRTA